MRCVKWSRCMTGVQEGVGNLSEETVKHLSALERLQVVCSDAGCPADKFYHVC